MSRLIYSCDLVMPIARASSPSRAPLNSPIVAAKRGDIVLGISWRDPFSGPIQSDV